MCIALLSTAHPSYQLILIDNRDEYINRPTAKAEWWPEPNTDVLGGRDLLREVQGTWLGVTRNGKIAVLTNYREDQPQSPEAVSRGAIIRKFLTEDVGPVEDFVRDIVNTGIARDAGGFSLVCGHVGQKLAVISNRAQNQDQVPWIAGDVVQTVGLSNAAFQDRSWVKVTSGEELMLEAIRENVQEGESEDHLIERLLELLSLDTLPRTVDIAEGGLDAYILELRHSILVPPLGKKSLAGRDEDYMRTAATTETVEVVQDHPRKAAQQLGVDGIYATQKQTVVLIDHDFRVRYFERTLYDNNSDPIPFGEGDLDYSFQIEV